MHAGYLLLFWGLLGTAVGSFLNVVADRLPVSGSLLSPPSHCPICGARLGPVELVPVVSYLALRGRCRHCRAPIGIRTLLVELVTGALFALACWRYPPTSPVNWLSLLLSSAYLAVLVVATVTDLERGLILDRIMIPALVLAGLGALCTGWPNLLYYLAGGLLGAGVIALIIFLVPGGMGGGDVRLAGFVGLTTGFPGVLFALFVGFVCGGMVAGYLLASGQRRRGETIPLGPFLALGGAVVLLFGDLLRQVFSSLAGTLG